MWKRFAGLVRCPLCGSGLQLWPFREEQLRITNPHAALAHSKSIDPGELAQWVEAGLFRCDRCSLSFPIMHGLPVLLPYATPIHEEFANSYTQELAALPNRYPFPAAEPVPGEQWVMRSFSTEWLAYDFDGVIWEMSYEDHERRFLSELGSFAPASGNGLFLEVGCGIGITTAMAQENFGVDGVGVDLSLAALRATVQHKDNPFLHFVQGSAFYLPLERGRFQTIYSRGVLHHTYSTERAFRNVAACCAPGGTVYLWVYGPGSIRETLFRRAIYALEKPVRGLISRNASGAMANMILVPMSLGYMVFNTARRLKDRTIQPYNFQRALHAARDRFTPAFAHRHDSTEVVGWFRDAGLEGIEVVDWKTMPSADHDDYRRNTGVRGRMAARVGP